MTDDGLKRLWKSPYLNALAESNPIIHEVTRLVQLWGIDKYDALELMVIHLAEMVATGETYAMSKPLPIVIQSDDAPLLEALINVEFPAYREKIIKVAAKYGPIAKIAAEILPEGTYQTALEAYTVFRSIQVQGRKNDKHL